MNCLRIRGGAVTIAAPPELLPAHCATTRAIWQTWLDAHARRFAEQHARQRRIGDIRAHNRSHIPALLEYAAWREEQERASA